MGDRKIQVGYGSDSRADSKAKGMYGKRRSGKVVQNGGFNFQPTVSFESIDDDLWNSVFPNGYKPYWDK